MEIKQLYQLFIENSKITTDSRNAEKGSIFFALKGDHFDGNQYAETAIKNGCSLAIVDNPNYAMDNRFILVDDVLESLQRLANYHRKQLDIPIIAVTGTNGKTTTKELIANVLDSKYKIHYTRGNLNNHIGVPLTLLSMNTDIELGVVEMGANHMNEIKELCSITEPDYGIITNIGKAHLEGFGSFENIIKTKSELYDYIKQSNGRVFCNENNNILKNIVKEKELDVEFYGGKMSMISGEVIDSGMFLSLWIKIKEEEFRLNTKLIGTYNFENVIAAAAIGNYFKVPASQIIKAIESYTPKNNRSQFLETKRNKLFLDAYNANPTSVEASIHNFNSLKLKNACVVLGDMLELGNDSEIEHNKIIHLLKSCAFKQVILVGDIYCSINDHTEFSCFKSSEELIRWIEKNNINDSNVLIKGSRGIQLEKIVEYL